MDWIANPDEVGGWLSERMDAAWSDMHSFVPHGFPAYARVFHPATVDERPAPWQEAAEAFGTTMHALAQWHRLVRIPPEDDWSAGERTAPDGREFHPPQEGWMPVETLAVVAEHLAAHTTTSDAGFAAVWEGWGGLLGFLGEAPSRAFLSIGGEDAGVDPNHQAMLDRSIHDPFNNGFRKATWQPGILSDEISRGERLKLPGRDHVLFSAAPRMFADAAWVLDAPWRDRPAEQAGFEPSAQHPSILWPEDRSWVMVSEIDLDTTIVAGPAELVRALCTDERIEALPIREGADLTWDADGINR